MRRNHECNPNVNQLQPYSACPRFLAVDVDGPRLDVLQSARRSADLLPAVHRAEVIDNVKGSLP